MSKSTPRKSRHRHHQSGSGSRGVQASDYESDVAHYNESRDMAEPSQLRRKTSNTDLNLSVLRRYQPNIRSILSIAANAVVYVFDEEAQNWDKSGVEGTMFVCEQEPFVMADGQTLPQACVFILNRRGLDNCVVDLVKVSVCEVIGELLILRLDDDEASADSNGSEEGGAEKRKVIGIWIHADQEHTREVNITIIRGAWQQAREALEAVYGGAAVGQQEAMPDKTVVTTVQVEPTVSVQGGQTVGRRLSITDLFGQRNHSRPTPTKSRRISDGDLTTAVAANHVIAALDTQLPLIASFTQWLEDHIVAGRDFGGFASKLKSGVHWYNQFILDARKSLEWDYEVTHDADVLVVMAERKRGDPLKIAVFGPVLHKRTEISAADESELDYIMGDEYLGYMSKICRGFSQAANKIASIFKMYKTIEEEESDLSQPGGVTIRTHTRLLQEYNDMKDIGQQLIGFIAENRGVPIGTLYEDKQYGVSADD
ncbi:hypothetical protein QBC46DRAFT_293772 [Diplogelasinospora grovesii]|uniref:Uncharacterized protein n=1 Tax=Diplogelasinospora grovesii TaxID=303347 RepID=A0AAN6S246_9PEZI|nr:hypothetical protein QBC46DRAFT_293772 [Diplogelasinospora grovesii]